MMNDLKLFTLKIQIKFALPATHLTQQ